jgi:hypothetical protein
MRLLPPALPRMICALALPLMAPAIRAFQWDSTGFLPKKFERKPKWEDSMAPGSWVSFWRGSVHAARQRNRSRSTNRTTSLARRPDPGWRSPARHRAQPQSELSVVNAGLRLGPANCPQHIHSTQSSELSAAIAGLAAHELIGRRGGAGEPFGRCWPGRYDLLS